MKPEKLTDIKKELLKQDPIRLTEICLRIAKYKKENKELLNYLLFDEHDPMGYAERVKASLEPDFKTLQHHYYYSTKSLRKILRLLNRHIKFTASKQVEIELLIWFCRMFLNHADYRSSHKPLLALFTRQMEKIDKTFPKLHEDLQFDYQAEYELIVNEAAEKMKSTPKKLFGFL